MKLASLLSAIVIGGPLVILTYAVSAPRQEHGLPSVLHITLIRPDTVRQESLKVDKMKWSSFHRTVTVERCRRPTPASEWGSTTQTMSASFDIAWVAVRVTEEIDALYVAGTYETDLNTIEKWMFTYGSEPLPRVRRSVLYQGSDLGNIASLALSPSGQFLFFVTYNPAKVYRIPNTELSTPTLVADEHTIQELGTGPIWTLRRRIHVTEGPKYMLADDRYGPTRDLPSNAWVITLNDPDDDGAVDSHSVFTVAEWNEAGMDNYVHWVH